jgi:CheY-like chemotaxis protein
MLKNPTNTADSGIDVSSGERRLRVLIADDANVVAQKLVAFFEEKGFESLAIKSGKELLATFDSFQPDFVFYDLMLNELNAMEFLKIAKAADKVTKAKIFVLSGHSSQANIKECLRLGAAEYILKPVTPADLLARMILQMQTKREIKNDDFGDRSGARFENGQYFIHLTDLIMREILKGAPIEDALHNLTGMAALSMKAVRVSITQCDPETRRGWVVASNDKKNIDRLEIDLIKYPELTYVLTQDKLLALDNLAADQTMHFVTRQLKSINFNSMIVAPIKLGSHMWGTLSVRLPDNRKKLADFEMRFTQLMAHVVALAIRREPSMMQGPGPGEAGFEGKSEAS